MFRDTRRAPALPPGAHPAELLWATSTTTAPKRSWWSNLFEPPSLLKNFGPRGKALLVQALTASGRDAPGARITVTSGARKQIDEVRSGGYHISQGDFRVHFGLGAITKADVTIRWPQGATESFKDVAANQWIVARQGQGIVERHSLASGSAPVRR